MAQSTWWMFKTHWRSRITQDLESSEPDAGRLCLELACFEGTLFAPKKSYRPKKHVVIGCRMPLKTCPKPNAQHKISVLIHCAGSIENMSCGKSSAYDFYYRSLRRVSYNHALWIVLYYRSLRTVIKKSKNWHKTTTMSRGTAYKSVIEKTTATINLPKP